MLFIKDIALPLIIAGISIGLILIILNTIIKIVGLDITIIRLILFLIVWYFVGPYIYNFLLEHIIINENDILRFIYNPVQIVKGIFDNLL